jgi:hypothetical protein
MENTFYDLRGAKDYWRQDRILRTNDRPSAAQWVVEDGGDDREAHEDDVKDGGLMAED